MIFQLISVTSRNPTFQVQFSILIDDLVFSYVFCDVYVLYIVPHKTAGTSLGFVLSVSASEVSTGLEASKDTGG